MNDRVSHYETHYAVHFPAPLPAQLELREKIEQGLSALPDYLDLIALYRANSGTFGTIDQAGRSEPIRTDGLIAMLGHRDEQPDIEDALREITTAFAKLCLEHEVVIQDLLAPYEPKETPSEQPSLTAQD